MLNLTAGGLSGGYRKYLHRVVPMLRAEGTVRELLVVVPPGHEQQPGVGAGAWSWQPGEHWRGYPALRDRVRAWKPDVVFIPTARYIDCQAPTVAMVQNMLPMLPPTFRDGIPAWAKLRLDAQLARYASTTATRVIAVSNYVRDYLVQEWGVPSQRIGVVYHGVDISAPVDTPPSTAVLSGKPFVFAAGSLYPYRGIEDAIRALPLLESRTLRLVIAGEGSASYRNRMEVLARQLAVTNRIVWLGQVDPTTMNYAYQQCAAFLMTSRVEACPNIALEAMANGARCISTTSAPMAEFFGDDALYYTPGDAPVLGRHINSVLAAPASVAQQRSLSAQRRAGEFTWEQTLDGVVTALTTARDHGL